MIALRASFQIRLARLWLRTRRSAFNVVSFTWMHATVSRNFCSCPFPLAYAIPSAGEMDTVRVLRKVVNGLLPPLPLSASDFHAENLSTQHMWDSASIAEGNATHLALVEVVGWLTIRAEHWQESIVVANQIARQIALDQRFSLLKDVVGALPQFTLDRARVACASNTSFALELQFWRTVSDGHEAFAAWLSSRPVA